MKVKYLSGKKINTVVEIDDAQAKGLIEDGIAEGAEEANDVLETAIKSLEVKINDKLTEATEKATALITDKISKSISKRPHIVVGPDNSENDPKGGFKSLSDFANSVKMMNMGQQPDKRLLPFIASAKAASPTNSGLNTADGGATMPPGFSMEIIDAVKASESLFNYIDASPISTRTMSWPVVKHYDFSNVTATAGIVASYKTEGSDGALSKAQYENLSYTLKTLTAFVPTTEELEEDTGVALGQFLAQEGARQINETITNNILNTVSGGVTPILGHASVKKQTRDTANAVKYVDVLNIYKNFYGNYANAVWIIHPTVLTQLGTMTSGNQNIFTPAGVAGNPFNQLLGRPIIISQYAATLGSEGDCGLYDLSSYKAVYRSDGVTTAMSPHLYFLAAQNVYRFTYRWDAKPKLTTVITLKDGSTTVSPFSILDDLVTS